MRPIKLKIAAFQSNGTYPLSERGRIEKKKKKLIARLLFLIGILFALTLLVKAFVGERGFIGLLKIKSEYASILNEVNQLKGENARLEMDIERLKNDKYYQEKLAREKMGFIREGEVVFLFPDGDKSGPFVLEGGNSDKDKEKGEEK